MQTSEAAERLEELGFADCGDVAEQVAAYQQWHGLLCDGVLGSVTERHLLMPRFCPLPDRMTQRGAMPKFPAGTKVTYGVIDPLPGFTLAQTAEIADQAVAEWGKLSGFTATRAADPSRAVVQMRVGQIDGRNGTLAYSYLAQLPVTQQLYDQHEAWKRGPGRAPIAYPYIDPLLVMLHELGHAWGLDHAPGSSHLMSAMYDPANAYLGAWEREQMQLRYGRPAVEPTPEPAPPAADDSGVTIFVPGGRVIATVPPRFIGFSWP